MNTDVMFSSKTDMWATPQDFFDLLNADLGLLAMYAQPKKMQSVSAISLRNRMDLNRNGQACVGAIHLMDD